MNRGTAERPIRVVHEGGIQHEVGGNDWQLDEAGGQRGCEGMPCNHNRIGYWLIEAVIWKGGINVLVEEVGT